MARAQVAVSSLAPNQDPEPIVGLAPDGPEIVPNAPLEHPGQVPAPEPPPAKRRPGRPRKAVQPVSAPVAVDVEHQALYAKVGLLALLAARSGKDIDTYCREVRDLLDAYDEVLALARK